MNGKLNTYRFTQEPSIRKTLIHDTFKHILSIRLCFCFYTIYFRARLGFSWNNFLGRIYMST